MCATIHISRHTIPNLPLWSHADECTTMGKPGLLAGCKYDTPRRRLAAGHVIGKTDSRVAEVIEPQFRQARFWRCWLHLEQTRDEIHDVRDGCSLRAMATQSPVYSG